MYVRYILLLLHLFNGLFSRATWVSRYKKGKTSLDWNQARDDGVLGWQWHQLDHMQTICTSLQVPTPHHSIFTGQMLFLMPNQQCQSTEGTYARYMSTANATAAIKTMTKYNNGQTDANCHLKMFPIFMCCDFVLPSVLWCCWLGGKKGIRPVKNRAVGCWCGICLERGADLHMAQLMPLTLTVSCCSPL